ncbi:MAG TPA: radical SAM protein [Stellaceae bacterium]|nr:radical SAM protein [Stellaceae bacterium]
MLNPETLVKAHRRVNNRKVKTVAFNALRWSGLRHLVVRMDTINLCNLRCKMCYYSFDYHRKREQMDLPLFRKIAEDVFPKTRFLYLSCATEPLMNKQFAEFLRIAGEYKVPFTSFCTNGQLLRKEVITACLDTGLSEIIFSIDGATAPTYEAIRRGGKWERLLENLDLLVAMKKEAGTTKPAIRINFTCMESNIRELPAMAEFAVKRGAQSLHVRHLTAYGGADSSYREEIAYRDLFNGMAAEAKKVAAAAGLDLFLPDPIPERDPSGKSCTTDGTRISRPKEANPYCMLPWFQAIISWNGDYRICSWHNMGNLREQSFAEIYNGPKMREIRNKMLWRKPDSCSWNCHLEAYDVPEVPEEVGEPEPESPIGAL